MQFPCWRYHATEPAVIVNDPAELMALGEGWHDNPSKCVDDPPAGDPPAEVDPESNPENEGEGNPPASNRCKCGKYTLANAEKKAHVCAE